MVMDFLSTFGRITGCPPLLLMKFNLPKGLWASLTWWGSSLTIIEVSGRKTLLERISFRKRLI
jgi:hypothetical protein